VSACVPIYKPLTATYHPRSSRERGMLTKSTFGNRDDPSTHRRVRWRPLEHSENVILDPIVLLMVHALRNGQVNALTIEEILQQMAAEPSRTLVWTNPSWPIIPAITSGGVRLEFPTPASTNQLHKSLLETGHIGGVIRDLWLHDLRRGSAFDNKNIKGLNAGVGAKVAASLGHSMNAFHKGTTALYADRESVFIPNFKEQQLRENPFGPKISAVPYKQQRIATHLINQAAIEHPPELNRRQLVTRIRNEQKRKWEEELTTQRTAAADSQKRRHTKGAESSRAGGSSNFSEASAYRR
jgi:hypothetical protein